MRWVRFAVLVCLAAVLQAGIMDIFAVTESVIKPNLLLILLVFFAIYSNTSEAIIASFIIGFAADLAAFGTPMGGQMISFGLVGTALAYLHRVVAVRTAPYQAMTIFFVSILSACLTHVLSFLVGQSTAGITFGFVLGGGIYTAIVGPFFFLPVAWWMRIKTSRFSRT